MDNDEYTPIRDVEEQRNPGILTGASPKLLFWFGILLGLFLMTLATLIIVLVR